LWQREVLLVGHSGSTDDPALEENLRSLEQQSL
jgi:hypothetical protein